jgi:hypothetical protein
LTDREKGLIVKDLKKLGGGRGRRGIGNKAGL